MMKHFFSLLPAFAASCLLSSCDLAKLSADGETRKLKERVAELEREREEAALEAELEEARRQLAIALSTLEEGDSNLNGEPVEADPGDLGEFQDVPRAVVVEEAPRDNDFRATGEASVALEETVPAALLDTGDHQIFFAELSRFGEWFETRDYGFVWQPLALQTDPDWRPYTRGRWVNSDQGWTWLSDEPFGWAVYHYGRWVLLAEQGWVWVPGDDWAPAWVSWRQNDDYLGWAPLPPETLYDEVYEYNPGIDVAYDVSPAYYNFVPVEHFYEPVHAHCVPRTTVVTIIISTRNVTRFSMRENHVHCGGPDFGWVNRHARRPARRCQITRGAGQDHFAHRHHHRLHEDRLHVFAPRVDASWNSAVCPSRVARNLGRVEIVRAGKREVERGLQYRHREAALRRHQAAREAMERPECQIALRSNQQRRKEAQAQLRRDGDLIEEQRDRRARAEEGLRAATEAVAVAERGLENRNLEPADRMEARRKIDQAERELAGMRESLDTPRVGDESRPGRPVRRGHINVPDKEERVAEIAREQAAEAKQRVLAEEKAAEEKRRVMADQKAAEARRLENARQQAAEAKQRALVEEKAAEEKRRVMADQKAAEANRLENARRQAAEAKQRALVEEKAAEEKRRVIAEEKAAEARRLENARRQAAESKQRALVEEKAAEEKRRVIAEQKAAEANRLENARRQAAEAKQRALVEEKAAEEKRRVIAEQKAAEARRLENARRQAAEAKQRALVEEKAAEEKRRVIAEQKAAEARRLENARRQAAEAKQRALVEEKAAEEKRRVIAEQKAAEARRLENARRQAAEAKQRALAEEKAAEEKRRVIAEQKAAEARRLENARRQAAEAKQRALVRQRAEEEARKQDALRRRSEIEVRRKAQVEAQRRSQQEAQRRAEVLQAKRRIEEQRAARAQAEARAKAKASAEAAVLRKKAELARREASKRPRLRKDR